MISIIFCSRAKDNPDSNLSRLLESVVTYTSPTERQHLEFLIKFDSDDTCRPSDAELQKFPLRIRTFTWSRGEGRHGLHHAQEYLFAQRDPRSRFCLMTADDFLVTRAGFVSEILSVPDEFCILGWRRPPIESFAGIWDREDSVRQWVVACGPWSPIVSTRLIEVCQNFGWQANVDSWLMGLSVAMYDLYRIVLWKQHEEFYARSGSYVRPASMGTAPTYNNMELTNNVGPLNRYWFDLVRRQARNVYLNIEYGTDHQLVPATKRVWRKLRAQPFRRLPGRLFRKLKRAVASVLT